MHSCWRLGSPKPLLCRCDPFTYEPYEPYEPQPEQQAASASVGARHCIHDWCTSCPVQPHALQHSCMMGLPCIADLGRVLPSEGAFCMVAPRIMIKGASCMQAQEQWRPFYERPNPFVPAPAQQATSGAQAGGTHLQPQAAEAGHTGSGQTGTDAGGGSAQVVGPAAEAGEQAQAGGQAGGGAAAPVQPAAGQDHDCGQVKREVTPQAHSQVRCCPDRVEGGGAACCQGTRARLRGASGCR